MGSQDPIASLKQRFILPEGVIYLDGNSLGPPLKSTSAALAEVVDNEWGRDLIASWNRHGWFDISALLAGLIAPLIGAEPDEVAVCDSISVNLFKLIASALSLRPGRGTILADRENFPTDLYMAQGVAGIAGVQLRLVDRTADLASAVDDDTACVMASHVDFRTGTINDMAAITQAAHNAGALALWDLAHSAGVMPVGLNAQNVDMAVGCTYKYLNGGPGAPAYLFVAKRHLPSASQPLSGWFGHEQPFAFRTDYEPATGIARFLAGTPPILSMRALQAGLELAAALPLDDVRARSLKLSERFLSGFDTQLAGHGFHLVSPRDPERRGGQLAFAHPHGYPIMQALIEAGVIGDFRAPDLLRFGFAPLYLDYDDMDEAVARLVRIMQDGRWREPRFERGSDKVT